MPCFANGFPIGPAGVPLEHFRFTDVANMGAFETILISWVATKHVRMEQMVAHWNTAPLASEPIVLSKLSVTNFRIDTILRSVDPSMTMSGGENLTDLVCVIPFYWAIGDTVEITFANTNNQNVGVEIMLVEVP